MEPQDRSLIDATLVKQLAEIEKLIEERNHYRKKNRWFDIVIGVAIFTAGIGFAELLHVIVP